MPSQEEMNKGMMNLLMMATELLEYAEKSNDNFKIAQNLVKQAFFKYLDLKDCPFRETCNQAFQDDYEPEAPYNWRDDID